MAKKLLKLSELGVLLLFLAGCIQPVKQARETGTVIIGDQSVSVVVVSEPEQQAKGLAGVKELSDRQGMLFLFPDEQVQTFWMKGMLIPIDIVWIRGNEIVGIEQNVQPSATDTSDNALARYTSPDAVDSVLELNAGFTTRYSVRAGDTVVFD